MYFLAFFRRKSEISPSIHLLELNYKNSEKYHNNHCSNAIETTIKQATPVLGYTKPLSCRFAFGVTTLLVDNDFPGTNKKVTAFSFVLQSRLDLNTRLQKLSVMHTQNFTSNHERHPRISQFDSSLASNFSNFDLHLSLLFSHFQILLS